MPAVVMDGKALAAKVKEQVRSQVEPMGQKPGLAVILVGDNPASRVYVNGKKKDCGECGIYSEEYALPGETTQEELLELIGALNDRADVDGILVQLPLPKHLNEKEVLLAIRSDKDVDCFHPLNVGQLMIGEEGFQPCTRQARCNRRSVQYRGEASGHAHGEEKRYRDHLSYQDSGFEGGMPAGGYFGGRCRAGRSDHRRYDSGGGRSGGRGHEPQRPGQAVRRRGLQPGG